MLRMLLARLQLLEQASTSRQAAWGPAVQAGARLKTQGRSYCAVDKGPQPTAGPSTASKSPHIPAVPAQSPGRGTWPDHRNKGGAPMQQAPILQQKVSVQPQHSSQQPQAGSSQAPPASSARHTHIVASAMVAEDMPSASYASQPGSPGPMHQQQQLQQQPGPPPLPPRPRSAKPLAPSVPLPHGQPLRPHSGSGGTPSTYDNGRRSESRSPMDAVNSSHDSKSTAGQRAIKQPLAYVRPSELPLQEKLQLLIDKLEEEQEILLDNVSLGTHRVVCPECGNGSRGEDCFAVTLEEDHAKWCCHRASCGFSGALSIYGQYKPGGPTAGIQQQSERLPLPQRVQFQPLTPELLSWLASRGISQKTLERNGVAMETRYHSSSRQYKDMIAYPYYRDGTVVNVKYRGLPKEFTQTKGGERIFYGFDDIKDQSEVIIVEGEMDKLALEEAGCTNVISVPTGARINKRLRQGPVPAPEKDTEFSYVYNCWDRLAAATKIVLATDNDDPGTALADELARRLGREKCWRVHWPKTEEDARALATAIGLSNTAADAASVQAAQAGVVSPPQAGQQLQTAALAEHRAGSTDADADGAVDPWFRKDANEVLMKDGKEVLHAYVKAAQPLPIRGLFRFNAFWSQICDLYQQGAQGLSWGISTGWSSVDQVYQVVPGELTIVTGVPNSGKSEWLDALAMNLAKAHGWSFALCSMENRPADHARKLMEKYAQKPFFDAAYAASTPRMSEKEVLEALVWIDERFHVIKTSDEELPTIEWILDKARAAVLRHGIRGLIIDPYNEISHTRPGNFSETEYVSQMLTQVKRFAQHYDCHVWFVAHPRQMSGWRGGAPNMYDISGSAHFINKADCGVVVHRPNTATSAAAITDGKHGAGADIAGGDPRAVQVLVRKVRNKLAGRIGDALLRYDRTTGCYEDYDLPPAPQQHGRR